MELFSSILQIAGLILFVVAVLVAFGFVCALFATSVLAFITGSILSLPTKGDK